VAKFGNTKLAGANIVTPSPPRLIGGLGGGGGVLLILPEIRGKRGKNSY